MTIPLAIHLTKFAEGYTILCNIIQSEVTI